MKCVIKILGLADGRPTTIDGMYLKSYDVKGREGRGTIKGTPALDDAIIFPTHEAAMRAWKTQYGYRADGNPNRPLTAYTVEIIPYGTK
jgi:hypothetical protein